MVQLKGIAFVAVFAPVATVVDPRRAAARLRLAARRGGGRDRRPRPRRSTARARTAWPRAAAFRKASRPERSASARSSVRATWPESANHPLDPVGPGPAGEADAGAQGEAGYPFPGTRGHTAGGGVCFAPVNLVVVSFDAAGSFAGAAAQNIAPLPSCSRIVTLDLRRAGERVQRAALALHAQRAVLHRDRRDRAAHPALVGVLVARVGGRSAPRPVRRGEGQGDGVAARAVHDQHGAPGGGIAGVHRPPAPRRRSACRATRDDLNESLRRSRFTGGLSSSRRLSELARIGGRRDGNARRVRRVAAGVELVAIEVPVLVAVDADAPSRARRHAGVGQLLARGGGERAQVGVGERRVGRAVELEGAGRREIAAARLAADRCPSRPRRTRPRSRARAIIRLMRALDVERVGAGQRDLLADDRAPGSSRRRARTARGGAAPGWSARRRRRRGSGRRCRRCRRAARRSRAPAGPAAHRSDRPNMPTFW